MKKNIVEKYLKYQAEYPLNCNLRIIEDGKDFFAYFDQDKKNIVFKNPNACKHRFKSEKSKSVFISTILAHEYRHAMVYQHKAFLSNIIDIGHLCVYLSDQFVEKYFYLITSLLVFISIYAGNAHSLTFFCLVKVFMHIPVIISEFDANLFAFKKEGYHSVLLEGQLSYLVIPVRYILLGISPEILPFMDKILL